MSYHAAGGIYNFGILTVIGTTIGGNAETAGAGGGITNTGTLRVIASTIAGNTAKGPPGYCVTILNCFPGGNGVGGGLYNNGGTAELVNSTLANNSAVGGNGCPDLHPYHCHGAGLGPRRRDLGRVGDGH